MLQVKLNHFKFIFIILCLSLTSVKNIYYENGSLLQTLHSYSVSTVRTWHHEQRKQKDNDPGGSGALISSGKQRRKCLKMMTIMRSILIMPAIPIHQNMKFMSAKGEIQQSLLQQRCLQKTATHL